MVQMTGYDLVFKYNLLPNDAPERETLAKGYANWSASHFLAIDKHNLAGK